MTSTEGRRTLQELREQYDRLHATYGDDTVLIVEADTIDRLLTDAAELRALRSLVAALPDDDWQPTDWSVFTLAQEEARTALEVSP